MNSNPEPVAGSEDLQIGPLPESLHDGATVLVASMGEPSEYAISLRLLRQYGTAADTAFVVTTTESAEQTIATYTNLEAEGAPERPSLRIVDMVSAQQSVLAPYDETPVVFTPSPGDLERLLVMLSELADPITPSTGAQHLIIRSLTPMLEAAGTPRVCTVLDQITDLRSETGLCFLGLDYTAHDGETMTALADHVDGVLWVTQSSPNRLDFEYQLARRRYNYSVFGNDSC